MKTDFDSIAYTWWFGYQVKAAHAHGFLCEDLLSNTKKEAELSLSSVII